MEAESDKELSAEVTALRFRVQQLEEESHKRIDDHLERMLESIVRAVPDIVYRLDAQGHIVFISDAIRNYGYEPEELLGTSIFELIHPEDRQKAIYKVNERRTGGRSTRLLEVRLLARNGAPVRFEFKADEWPTLLVNAEGVYSSGKDAGREFLFTQGVARDISERRWHAALLERRVAERTAELRAEVEQRRQAENRLRLAQLAMDRAGEVVFWFGAEGCFTYVNDEACRLLGYERQELLGKHVYEIGVERPAREEWPALWEEIRQGPPVKRTETHFRRKDGRLVPVEVTANYLNVEGCEYVCSYARDISARRRRLEREETLGRIRDQIIAMRQISDLPKEQFWVEQLNKLGVPAGGVSMEFPSSEPGHFYVHRLDGNRSKDIAYAESPWVKEVFDGGQPAMVSRQRLEALGMGDWPARCILEVPLPGAGGSLGVNSHVQDQFDEEERRIVQLLAGLIAVGLQRVRDFEALRQSEERYRAFVEELPIGVVHTAPDGKILYQNPHMRDMLGYTAQELDQMKAQDFYVHPEDRQDLVQQLEEKGEHSYQYLLRRKDGQTIWLRGKTRLRRDREGRPIRYQGFAEDITAQKLLEEERDRLEEQLRQAQKMEAVGQLTAGIAHNFNNMLQAIMGNIHLALLEAGEGIRPLLETAQHSASRAADMVRQLMIFSRQGLRPQYRPLVLAEVLSQTVEIARKTFDRKVQIAEELGAEEALVVGDAGQLQQVFMNLLLNARDALEEAEKQAPTIWVRQERALLSSEATGKGQAGMYLRIEVEDNGAGMDEATRRRIFEPFFTTKPVNKGTGLGLSTVYGIVQQHGGWIECSSRMGQGTRFTVYLPLSQAGEPSRASEGMAPVADGGQETLLIVDDEEMVRDSTQRILERYGYRVLTAPGGAEGLELLQSQEIDLVILDLSMPVMSGQEMLAELRRRGSRVKVIIFTGYPAEPEQFGQVEAVIQKPFALDALRRAVRAALDR